MIHRNGSIPFQEAHMHDKKVKNDTVPKESGDWKKDLVSLLCDLVRYISVIIVVFLLLFRIIVVSGDSMNTTLLDGDYLFLISNSLYRDPAQGDVVVISKQTFDNGVPIVKRIIAVEGQIVDIDFENGIVYVDGLPLEETYVNTPTNRQEGMAFPMLIEKGCYFVLGDNRNNSRDSRHPDIGLVDRREILGKAILLILPGTDEGMSPRDFGRIGVIK